MAANATAAPRHAPAAPRAATVSHAPAKAAVPAAKHEAAPAPSRARAPVLPAFAKSAVAALHPVASPQAATKVLAMPDTRRRQHRYARLRINILRHTPLHRCTHQHLRISSLRLLPQRQSSRRSNRPRQFQPEFCPRRLGPPRPSRPRPHIGNPSRSWRRSLHQRPRATAPGSHSPRTLRKPSRTA